MAKVVRLSVGLALAFTLLSCAPSQQLTEQQRMEVFQFVWEEVRRSHYDPELGGVDWDAVREAYLLKARAAESDAAFYAVLNEMLGELKQSHFGVIPPGAFVAQEEARRRISDGEVGVSVQLVAGKPLIVRVRDGSPAARMGIPTGAELLAIDDTPAEAILQRIRARNLPEVEERFEAYLAFRAYLSGRVGSTVVLRYRDLDGIGRTATLLREATSGERVRIGFLPELRVRIESRILPGNIGYLAFNAFMPPVMRELPDRLRELQGHARADYRPAREPRRDWANGGRRGGLSPTSRNAAGRDALARRHFRHRRLPPAAPIHEACGRAGGRVLGQHRRDSRSGLTGDQACGHRWSLDAWQGVAIQNRRAAARGLPAVRAGGLRDGG
jgi:hypothetical protein